MKILRIWLLKAIRLGFGLKLLGLILAIGIFLEFHYPLQAIR
jgi:hypothetical protein